MRLIYCQQGDDDGFTEKLADQFLFVAPATLMIPISLARKADLAVDQIHIINACNQQNEESNAQGI